MNESNFELSITIFFNRFYVAVPDCFKLLFLQGRRMRLHNKTKPKNGYFSHLVYDRPNAESQKC